MLLDPCLLHGAYHPISTQTELAGICELSRKAVDIWAGAYGSEADVPGSSMGEGLVFIGNFKNGGGMVKGGRFLLKAT